MTDLGAALTGVVACGLAGALAPYVIRRLPEPPPDPEPEEGVELTAAQQARLEEPSKELYADLGRRTWVLPVSVAVSGIAGGLLGLVLGWDWLLLVAWPLAPVGALLGIVDWRTRLLPSIVVLPATALALLYGLGRWLGAGEPEELVRGVIALLVVRSVFWLLWFIRQAGMGFGDVRLSALLGLVLGYAGWGPVMIGIYAAFLAFGVPGLALAIARRDLKMLKRAYPFGPFLLVGALVGLVWGQTVADAIYG
ncbi:leader peptidase (prepilin peptidase)/N-methyltransferase [Nocardioides thalensis]|uniref:Leader peptidase (Prepilin peptidase)/N-methyltransferase n=1 Tax=Nocardioides thalensis TaxID=1914755 RepID=A0A853C4F3_9ACTN|nr:leader peptidase (prepilin peptidase)/N-methyltransferase [Nocardioides thalensis]